ncbi:hypothetical protein Ahy_A03g015873 isoform B [Arachis hypogaea]|uniref:Uncharacterized protein n=1 Tax=Arachis hypogaea TaxID=3818 RepID=A0A445E1J0_ARAHY|nr:hypothetical protein Ahy_A03g015873 isoform B [Arachis hypogaea]
MWGVPTESVPKLCFKLPLSTLSSSSSSSSVFNSLLFFLLSTMIPDDEVTPFFYPSIMVS